MCARITILDKSWLSQVLSSHYLAHITGSQF